MWLSSDPASISVNSVSESYNSRFTFSVFGPASIAVSGVDPVNTNLCIDAPSRVFDGPELFWQNRDNATTNKIFEDNNIRDLYLDVASNNQAGSANFSSSRGGIFRFTLIGNQQYCTASGTCRSVIRGYSIASDSDKLNIFETGEFETPHPRESEIQLGCWEDGNCSGSGIDSNGNYFIDLQLEPGTLLWWLAIDQQGQYGDNQGVISILVEKIEDLAGVCEIDAIELAGIQSTTTTRGEFIGALDLIFDQSGCVTDWSGPGAVIPPGTIIWTDLFNDRAKPGVLPLRADGGAGVFYLKEGLTIVDSSNAGGRYFFLTTTGQSIESSIGSVCTSSDSVSGLGSGYATNPIFPTIGDVGASEIVFHHCPLDETILYEEISIDDELTNVELVCNGGEIVSVRSLFSEIETSALLPHFGSERIITGGECRVTFNVTNTVGDQLGMQIRQSGP